MDDLSYTDFFGGWIGMKIWGDCCTDHVSALIEARNAARASDAETILTDDVLRCMIDCENHIAALRCSSSDTNP